MLYVFAGVWTSTSALRGCGGLRRVKVGEEGSGGAGRAGEGSLLLSDRVFVAGGHSGRGPRGGALNVIVATYPPQPGHGGRGVTGNGTCCRDDGAAGLGMGENRGAVKITQILAKTQHRKL